MSNRDGFIICGVYSEGTMLERAIKELTVSGFRGADISLLTSKKAAAQTLLNAEEGGSDELQSSGNFIRQAAGQRVKSCGAAKLAANRLIQACRQVFNLRQSLCSMGFKQDWVCSLCAAVNKNAIMVLLPCDDADWMSLGIEILKGTGAAQVCCVSARREALYSGCAAGWEAIHAGSGGEVVPAWALQAVR